MGSFTTPHTQTGASPVRVAIVDDSPPDRALISAMLGHNAEGDVEITTAPSLAAAVDLLAATRHDCVLLDLNLPDGDGVEVVRRLTDAAPDVAVIVLTGWQDTESAAAAIRLGAQDYLSKDRIDGDVLWRSLRYAVDRHQTHRALLLSEQRHRRTLDAVGEGIVLFDALPDGTVRRVLANPVAEDLVHRVGMGLLQGSHDPRARRIVDAAGRPVARDELPVLQVARTGQASERYVLGLVREEGDAGDAVWVRTTARPITDDDGRLTGIVASVTDITAERTAARQLAQSHARFAAMVEHNADPIVLYDAGAVLRYASPALGRVIGDDTACHLDRPVLDLVHPGDWRRLALLFRAQLAQPGSVVDFDTRLRRVDGTWRHVEVTQTNLLDDPAVGGVVANIRDMTGRDVTGRDVTGRDATGRDATGRDVTGRDVTDRMAHQARLDVVAQLRRRGLAVDRLGATPVGGAGGDDRAPRSP